MKKIKPFRDTGGKLSQEGFLKKLGIPKTFLTFHNLGSYTSEFVEIGMPYMIIHESTDHKRGELNSLEFTESNKNIFSPPQAGWILPEPVLSIPTIFMN